MLNKLRKQIELRRAWLRAWENSIEDEESILYCLGALKDEESKAYFDRYIAGNR